MNRIAGLSNNLLRILTGLVGIPVVLGLAYVGGWPFLALVAVLALLAQFEMYRLLQAAGAAPRIVLGMTLGGLILLHQAYDPALGIALAILVLALVLSPFEWLFGDVSEGHAGEPDGRSSHAAAAAGPISMGATLFGVIYPTLLLGFLAEIRSGLGGLDDDVQAFALTVATLVLVWTTDTFAYFVGRAIGKRPLAPTISPKKTWAGTVGGVVSALAAGVVLKLTLLGFLAWIHVLSIALLCGVLGQLADLAQSKMKRQVGVKDSGSLLPGHGGMLDRFDSMILVAPAVYLYLRYVVHLAA